MRAQLFFFINICMLRGISFSSNHANTLMLSSREYLIIEHVLLFFPRKTQACAFIFFVKISCLYSLLLESVRTLNATHINFTRFFCLFGATLYFIVYELAIKELYV